MAKDKPEELSRRDFIGIALGSALVAGIGCGNDKEGPGDSGTTGGTQGTDSSTKSTEPGEGGSGNGDTKATGGSSSSSKSSKTDVAKGGSSSKSSSSAEGGANESGGSSSTGGKSSGQGGSSSSKSSSAQGGSSSSQSGSASGGTSTAQGGTTNASTSATGDTPYVAMVRDTDWAKATEDAINLAGGFPDLTGKTVVIRPNVIEGRPDGTTSPEVIRGVIRAAKKKGASEILVAEDAFNGGVLAFMETLGITKVCEEEGATPTELKNSKATKVNPANATAWTEGIEFYDIVKNAGYVINVPKCKTHGTNASFSLSLKAWLGSLKRPNSGTLHTSLPERCAEAHLARQEDFVVIDATRCMTTGGPMQGGTMKDAKVVVATKDPIAADVTGVAIIRYNGGLANTVPWNHAQIKRAMSLKYPGWLSAKTDFTYKAVGIDEADAIMAKRS